MKKIMRFFLIAAVGSAMILGGCKKSPMDIFDDFNLRLGTDVIKYKVSGNILDVADPSVNVANAQVIIEGEDADLIYDATNGKKQITVAPDGSFSLGVHPKHSPSASRPLRFNVFVMANGYIAGTEAVEIHENETRKNLTVGLVSYSNPPSFLELDVENVSLNGGSVATDQTFKGKMGADSVYYDDGLTTVILTKDTRFYYWSYEKTGTAYRPADYKEVIDTVSVNGVTYTVTRKEAIMDTVDVMGHVKKLYTKGDLEIVAYYSKGNDLTYRVHEYEEHSEKLIDVMGEENVPVKNLLFESAVSKRMYFLAFNGKDDLGMPIQLVPFNEPGKPKWFTSFVIDASARHPLTGNSVQEGDSIEVGYDVEKGRTIREVVKKAANGQLRVETQQINAGYYARALNHYTIDYTLDASKPEIIPDPENLIYAFGVRIGDAELWRSGNGYRTQPIKMKYNISTKDPETPKGFVYSTYCDQSIEDRYELNSLSGNVDLYRDDVIASKFPDRIDFDVNLVCPDGKVVVKPTYFGFFTSHNPHRRMYVDMKDGQWATRGIRLGEEYTLSGTANGSTIDTTLSVNASMNIIDYMLKEGNDICP